MPQKRVSAIAQAVPDTGFRRLLMIQLALIGLSVWLGVMLYCLRDSAALATAMVLVTIMAVVVCFTGLSHSARRFIGRLGMALVIMATLVHMLPPAWLTGPAIWLLALGCAALAVWSGNRTKRPA